MPKLEDQEFNTVKTDETVDTGDAQAKRKADKKGAPRDAEAAKVDASVKSTMKIGCEVSEESIKELFADVEGLSEDFASKAATLLEGAMSARLSEIKEGYEALLEESVQEAVSSLQEEYLTKIDQFISYVAETYVTENELAINSGIREEIAEEVVGAIRAVVENYGVDLPEEKIDIADALAEEVAHTEKELTKVMNENIDLRKKVEAFEVKEIFESATSDLTDAGKEKLARLCENISYGSVEDYRKKVETLKESVIGSKKEVETLEEQTVRQPLVEEKEEKKVDPRKAQVLDTMKYFL